MEAGVFFYLTKPFEPDVLLRMVHTAVVEGLKWQGLAKNLRVQGKALGCLQQGRFRVQTIDEAYDLALLIAPSLSEFRESRLWPQRINCEWR